MKKQSSKPGLAVEVVNAFPKSALGECALLLASTLLRGCQTRGHFGNGFSNPESHATLGSRSVSTGLEIIGGTQR